MPKKPSFKQRLGRASKFISLKTVSAFKKITSRSTIANIMMLSFILLCAFGAGMIYLPAGFLTAGVCCGLYGFLLGSE